MNNLNNKLQCSKSAVAFFFLFFLHEISIGNGHKGISYNYLIVEIKVLLICQNHYYTTKVKS